MVVRKTLYCSPRSFVRAPKNVSSRRPEGISPDNMFHYLPSAFFSDVNDRTPVASLQRFLNVPSSAPGNPPVTKDDSNSFIRKTETHAPLHLSSLLTKRSRPSRSGPIPLLAFPYSRAGGTDLNRLVSFRGKCAHPSLTYACACVREGSQ